MIILAVYRISQGKSPIPSKEELDAEAEAEAAATAAAAIDQDGKENPAYMN